MADKSNSQRPSLNSTIQVGDETDPVKSVAVDPSTSTPALAEATTAVNDFHDFKTDRDEEKLTDDVLIVDWDGPDDPANPKK